MFRSENGDFDIQKTHIDNTGEYVITAGATNNGILGKSSVKAKIIKSNTITVDMFGLSFYRNFSYKMVTHARVFTLIPKVNLTDNQGIFISNSLRYLTLIFGYNNMCSWNKIKNEYIQLPTKNGEIDFDFMESFVAELEAQRVAELEAYLNVTGLKDYELTEDEKIAIDSLDSIEMIDISFDSVFDKIKQGRRLRKEDQIKGKIPFVMAGITNTGVVGYISNPVASFKKNSITVDIFGNTFYRNYDFGAGDDTGVYWSEKMSYSPTCMLYFATSVSKSLKGKFSYGKKLRSSQSKNILMKLPTKNGEIDYQYMETLVSAIQKLVIKDVVHYTDKKINTTRQVINNKRGLEM